MQAAPVHERDPLGWCALFAAAFLALLLYRLPIPSHPYFDEIHYLPAARALLDGSAFLNPEHPPLGKLIIAGGIALLGDNAWGWRLPSALAGALALFGFMRAMWFAAHTRFATLAFGILLASGFLLFVTSRIAMLDGFMIAFVALALWQWAGAMREPETGRRRLALGGIALGLALASKWNVAPLAPLPGLVFLGYRLAAGRRRLLLSRRGAPVPGITLLEAGVWLGLVPLLVYAATYLPGYLVASNPLSVSVLEQHRVMLALQESVVTPHNYQSNWNQWILNIRAIWYLFEVTDGAQRGIVLLGNPLTMLLGLPALLWAAWAGVVQKNRAALASVLLYVVSLGFWVAVNKPIQFYYHYLLPSCFLLAALALACDTLWQRGGAKSRVAALAPVVASVVLFVHFFPILDGAPLPDLQYYNRWMWLETWR